MLKMPSLYSVGVDYQQDVIGLVQKRAHIAHSAAVILEKCQLIKYERSTGRFQSTELGRIASHYYVTHNSMMTYNQHLRPTMSTLELYRVFALLNEFKLLPVCLTSMYSSSLLIPVLGPTRGAVFYRQDISITDHISHTGKIGTRKTSGACSNTCEGKCRRTCCQDQCTFASIYISTQA